MTFPQDEGFGGAAELQVRGKLSPSIRSQRVPAVPPRRERRSGSAQLRALRLSAGIGAHLRAFDFCLLSISVCPKYLNVSSGFIYLFIFFFQSPRRAAQNCSTSSSARLDPSRCFVPRGGRSPGLRVPIEGGGWGSPKQPLGLRTPHGSRDAALLLCGRCGVWGSGWSCPGGELCRVEGQGGAGRS